LVRHSFWARKEEEEKEKEKRRRREKREGGRGKRRREGLELLPKFRGRSNNGEQKPRPGLIHNGEQKPPYLRTLVSLNGDGK